MDGCLKDFEDVKPKNSSEKALQRWRKACWLVKNRKRRFRFTANLSKRFEVREIQKSNQETSVTKAPKRSPLIWSMVVLLFATLCTLYVFSICTGRTNFLGPNYLTISRIDDRKQLCRNVITTQVFDSPYLHFPDPETFERQECACNPVMYFAIVSMQRSGSGWFETLLNSHMNLSSNGEIFGARKRRNNVSVIYEHLDRVYNLDWLSSASKNKCTAAVGFKWMLNQGLMEYHEEIAEYLMKRGVSIIFLFRRNLVRRMVSLLANSYDKEAKLLNGTHKSHVHSPHDAQILAKYKPALNVTVLVSSLKSAERQVAKALDSFKTTRHIVFYYEDILTNRTKLVDVQEFLMLPTRNLTSLQVKIHSGPLSSQISNFDDVRQKLIGTPYEEFFSSDYEPSVTNVSVSMKL